MGSIFQNPTVKLRYIPQNEKHEQSLQLMVCQYLRLQYPDVIFRSDFASGLHLSQYQATLNKRLQSSRAFPDLFIYKASRGYAGLALELKREGTTIVLKTGPRKGKLSTNPHIQEQALMLKNLQHEGFYANFAVGYDEAVKIIDWYFCRRTPQNAELF